MANISYSVYELLVFSWVFREALVQSFTSVNTPLDTVFIGLMRFLSSFENAYWRNLLKISIFVFKINEVNFISGILCITVVFWRRKPWLLLTATVVLLCLHEFSTWILAPYLKRPELFGFTNIEFYFYQCYWEISFR